jgi:hypothetical protein
MKTIFSRRARRGRREKRIQDTGIRTQAIIVSGLGIQVPVSWLIFPAFSADSSEAGERKAFVFISE